MKEYDNDKSGSLNAEELTKCIQVYSNSRHWTTDPVTPTDEEISLLLKGAGHLKQNTVDASEIQFALDLWHSYVTNRPKIETIFEKYDTDHTQKLEFDQLVTYLTDLNEGHKPKVAPARHRDTRSLDVDARGCETSESGAPPSRRTPRSGRCCSR
jgi:Ca2+-binding EF-hand superfamily protein